MSTLVKIDDLKDFHLVDGIVGKMIHTDRQTVSFFKIEKGAVLPLHHHVHEQISVVTKGQLELTIDGKTEIYEPGKVAVIPSNVPHSAIALTAVEVTDVFSPARDDYR